MRKNKKIKILHLLETLDCGGIERILTSIYSNIDTNKYQFDFLIMRDLPHLYYTKEIEKLGGRIFKYYTKKNKLWNHFYNILYAIRHYGPYDAVYSNWIAFNGFSLLIAYLCGIKNLISHVHLIQKESTNKFKNFYQEKVFKSFLKKEQIIRLACSKEAGIALYGNSNFEIIKNGVDYKSFSFNMKIRNKIREELKLQNKFVIMQTARFAKEKNQLFTVEIFKELLKKEQQSILVFAGDGIYLKQVQDISYKYNLQDKIKFLGAVSNINEILQAADVFVLPSSWEALGISIIEAQASGLPCVVSDNIPAEAFVTNVIPLSLKQSAEKWAETLLQFKNFNRTDTHDLIIKAGYDIAETAKKIERIFESFK